jgi:acyl carrier protein
MDETMATREKDDLVFHKACELLKPYNRGNAALQMNTHISVDLEIDSVAVLDLIMEVEDAYEISIPMNSIAEIQTIGDLVNIIHDLDSRE